MSARSEGYLGRACPTTSWVLAIAGLLALGSAPAAAAQSDAESGADVLALAPSPRATAFGGAYTAGAPGDPFALFANPAGIAGPGGPADPGGVGGWSVGAAFRAHVGDASAGSLAARFAGLGGAAAVAVRYLDYGEVDELIPDPAFGGERGMATGARIRGTEVALSGAYAFEVGPFAAGAGFDLVRTDLAELQDVAVAGSAGARVGLWEGRVGIGAAVQHLGADAAPGRDAPLPRTYRGGVSLALGVAGPLRLRVLADAAGPWDRLRPAVGAEVGIAGTDGVLLEARAGWDGSVEREDALEEWSWGGGLVVGDLAIDYAYRGIGVLGAAHQIGARLRR
ncbi:MAG TPA: hypothetical protein VK837_14300 [Longimicrobiales bacterium]|nr:hypothetical protein [Longimicrobiales bacterium]